MEKRFALRALFAVAMLAGLLMPASRAHASGTVGTGTPGSCSESALDSALTSGGLIAFNCGPAPFFLVLTSMKTISVDTIIDGGSLVTLDGGGFIQLFTVNSGHSLTLRNLTLRGGKGSFGGAISNNGTLNVVNSTFTSNTAGDGGAIVNDGTLNITNGSFFNNSAGTGGFGGAIDNDSALTINGGYFSGNAAPNGFGGAISNSSSTTINNSYFVANRADFGGAIETSIAALTISRTTFYRNTATSIGGAIEGQGMNVSTSTFDTNSAPRAGAISGAAGTSINQSAFYSNDATSTAGGAFDNEGSPNTVTDSTFYGNHATTNGGAIYNGGGLTVNNSTVAGSTGGYGIYNASSLTLENTIISGNTPDNCFSSGSFTSAGHNLDSGGACALGGAGDLSGMDPKLGPVANNGGPTQSMSLLAGSPAIDHGSNASCAPTDQRGVVRPQGGVCDIGAYEVRALTFRSVGSYDGWVLESGKGTKIGGGFNTLGTLLVGDDASNRRYRSILSFNTAALPDAAALVQARLQVRQQAMVGHPFGTQGTLMADLKTPYFGAGITLASSDWQAPATVIGAAAFGSVPVSGWYTAQLSALGMANISKTAATQFRLRFGSEIYNGLADYLSLYSGDTTTLSARPALTVYFNP